MNVEAPNLNALWCRLLVEELYRSGVRLIALAPGSRSSPLALAAIEHPRMETVVHFDERALAFLALGWARSTGRPAAVITTSGTAVANLFPAVAEASLDHIPLLLITADRPPELRDTAANQTMDQVKIFGSYVRWQFDLPCPDPAVPLRMLLTTVDQAVARSTQIQPGPVHLNQMFREPLAPLAVPYPRRAWLAPLQPWIRSPDPLTTFVASQGSDVALPPMLLAQFAEARQGVVVAGALPEGEREPVREFAQLLGWPILPDIQSGLRNRGADDLVIPQADLLLARKTAMRALKPDFVVVVGGRITSKRLAALTQPSDGTPVLRVSPFLDRQDPSHTLTWHVVAAVSALVHRLAQTSVKPASSTWLNRWREEDSKVSGILARRMKASGLHEPRVAWELTRLAPPEHAVFVGNSLPIRMLDTFSPRSARGLRVAANRGVSGIDGLLATAVGYARGRGKPVTLLLGDLSLLHDLNSLSLLKASPVPVVAVVVNNNGGGIFSFLPVAGSTPHFETIFGTPHGRSFAGAAAMFELPYQRVTSVAAFSRAYRTALRNGCSCLLEVVTRRPATVRAWRSLQAATSA